MATMFLPVLCLLLFICQAVIAEGVDKESAGCKYVFRHNSAAKGKSVNQAFSLSDFDACLSECANYNSKLAPGSGPCEIVTFLTLDSDCHMYSKNPSLSEDQLFEEQNAADTAITKTCGGKPPPPYVTTPSTTAPVTTPPPPYSAPVDCGVQDSSHMPSLQSSLRIVKGQEAVPHSWPWQVALLYKQRVHHCGASLIRTRTDREESDMVLTAGHCMYDDEYGEPDYQYITVRVGKHNMSELEDGEQLRHVVAAKRYELYVNFTHFDILLAQLDQPIRFTKSIRPVCLPTQDEEPPVGKECYATGWGRIDPKNELVYSEELRQAVMNVNSNKTCADDWEGNYNSTIHLCAGNGIRNFCNTDSGGPWVCLGKDNRWTQHGIISFMGGNGTCTNATQPGVLTRVSYFAKWIQDNVNDMTSMK